MIRRKKSMNHKKRQLAKQEAEKIFKKPKSPHNLNLGLAVLRR